MPRWTIRGQDIFTMGVANGQSLKLRTATSRSGQRRRSRARWKEDKGFYRVVVKVLPKRREASADAETTMSRVIVAVRAIRQAVEQPATTR
jgi:hypothetical protein